MRPTHKIVKLVGYGPEQVEQQTRWEGPSVDSLTKRCNSLNGFLIKKENFVDRYVIVPIERSTTPYTGEPWINYPRFVAGVLTCGTCGVVIHQECTSC
jgi:hypothetical protein